MKSSKVDSKASIDEVILGRQHPHIDEVILGR